MITYPEVVTKVLEGYEVAHQTVLAMSLAKVVSKFNVEELDADEFLNELAKSAFDIEGLGFADFANDIYFALEKPFARMAMNIATIFRDHFAKLEEEGGDDLPEERKQELLAEISRKIVINIYGVFMEGFLTARTEQVRVLLGGE